MGMDLDRWSREELQAEATRRGIPNASAMDRAALVRALRRLSRFPAALTTARSLINNLVQRVRTALPGSGPPPMPPRPDRPSPPRSPTPTPVPQEPILTQTMAGVLAAQGHDERALAIYDHLLHRSPQDRDLATAAERVRERLRGAGETGSKRNVDQVVAVPVRGAILVSWQVGPGAIARSRTVLGADGELSARLLVVTPDPAEGARTLLRELRPAKSEGEWLVDDIPPEGKITAAVGLTAGDRFVSVAHSATVVLGRGTVGDST